MFFYYFDLKYGWIVENGWKFICLDFWLSVLQNEKTQRKWAYQTNVINTLKFVGTFWLDEESYFKLLNFVTLLIKNTERNFINPLCKYSSTRSAFDLGILEEKTRMLRWGIRGLRNFRAV